MQSILRLECVYRPRMECVLTEDGGRIEIEVCTEVGVCVQTEGGVCTEGSVYCGWSAH